MALGRHRAEPPTHSAGQNLPSDFPLWGAFITVVACSSMIVFGVSVVANVGITAVLALGFFLVWWLAFSAGRSASPSPEPGITETEDAPAPLPAHGAVRIGSEDDEGIPGATDPDSRWIDTFGPPETGQLPIQRYVEGMSPGTSSGPLEETKALPQWSHSRT